MFSEWLSPERGKRVVALSVRITVYMKISAVPVWDKYLVVATSFLLWMSRWWERKQGEPAVKSMQIWVVTGKLQC